MEYIPPLQGKYREYNEYDHIFVASNKWTNELINKLDVPVESLLQCTDPELFYPEASEEYQHELLFVGNGRNVFRKIIKDLLPTERDFGLSVIIGRIKLMLNTLKVNIFPTRNCIRLILLVKFYSMIIGMI